MILLTLVFSSLLTSIWFYSSRGTQCCTEIRTLLDLGAGQSCTASPMPPPPPNLSPPSPPSLLVLSDDAAAAATGCDPMLPAGPCLGYTGGCGDLQVQFATLQGAYFYGDPGDESCHSTLEEYGALASEHAHAFLC